MLVFCVGFLRWFCLLGFLSVQGLCVGFRCWFCALVLYVGFVVLVLSVGLSVLILCAGVLRRFYVLVLGVGCVCFL